jgi:hypothetical protein
MKERFYMKLGELRKQTAHLSDDVEIICVSDNFEMSGSWVKATGVEVVRVKKKSETFRDAFDNTRYNSDVYIPDENGDEVLKI